MLACFNMLVENGHLIELISMNCEECPQLCSGDKRKQLKIEDKYGETPVQQE